MVPGTLKAVKAIGWYIEEYGIAQVSMNLTDLAVTPLHVAFDEVCRQAEARGRAGHRVGAGGPGPALRPARRRPLFPAEAAALRSACSEAELIRIAVTSLGLDELAPFDPEERVIEYRLRRGGAATASAGFTVAGFADETAAESVAPGRRLGGRRGRRAGRRARHHGGQSLGPQAGLGRALGGVLRVGRAGSAAQGRAAAPGGRGHPGLQRR